jgi:hypothetical protein
MSQLPLQPSMQRLQMPDWGATSRERFLVSRHSLALGRCRFMVGSVLYGKVKFDKFDKKARR